MCIFDKTFFMLLRHKLSYCLLPIAYCLLLIACSSNSHTQVDLIVHHAKIYSSDANFSVAEAMAVKDGKIVAIGKNDDIMTKYEAKKMQDAGGKAVFPGFIDAHAHFLSYGKSLSEVDLTGTESWDEVVARVTAFEKTSGGKGFIIGRGWDQNDWKDKEFPTNEKFNALFPDRPLMLTRVDGHAAIANNKALEMADIKPGQTLIGGEIETSNGKLTGLLIDNAVDLVSAVVPAAAKAEYKKWLLAAEKNCFATGLTTINDCGLNSTAVEMIKELQSSGDLKMRLYVMLSDEKSNFDYLQKNGIIKTDRLNVRSIKVYADGALGSRGACLLQPYSDKPGWWGFLLSPQSHFDSVANIISQRGWQMCTHAIGDSGNRAILNIYAKYLKGKNDLRWRIEHAQVVNENDFHFFGDYNIIPSVQPTHATSDMYWAQQRLGAERVKGAYAFKQLMEQNKWIPLGTDFPVEDISPFKTFFASVARQDNKNYPPNGFQLENALTRQQTLLGMTIWAAKACFEEKEKGSLEAGKFADFIILDTDIMTCSLVDILKTKVLSTYCNGEKVYDHQ